jgi:hypothetical protein
VFGSPEEVKESLVHYEFISSSLRESQFLSRSERRLFEPITYFAADEDADGAAG